MRTLFLFLLVLACCISCTDKKSASIANSQNDSLDFYFREANIDSLPFDLRFKYAKRAEEIVMKGENDSMHRVNMFKVANRYWNIESYKRYIQLVNVIQNKSLDAKDSSSIAKACIYLGDYYQYNSVIDSAFYYYYNAEQICEKIDNINLLAKSLYCKAEVIIVRNDLALAEKTLLQVLRELRNTDNLELLNKVYNEISIVYFEMHEYEKAIKYLNKNIALQKKHNINNLGYTESLNNLGIVYEEKKNYRKAAYYYYAALSFKNLKTISPYDYVCIYSNLANAKFKIQHSNDFPKMFFKALRMADSLKSYTTMISCRINLSKFHQFKGNHIKAFDYAQNAYNLAIYAKLFKYKILSLKQILSIKHENSIKYTAEYIRINDSLQFVEQQDRNKFARFEYETEELELENKKLTSQRSTIIFISSILFLVLVLVLLVFYQKSKIRRLKFLKEQQKSDEEIYKLMLDQQQKIEEGKQIEKKRISKELHDGVMGRLSSIRLNLFVLSKKTDQGTINKCLRHIDEIQSIEKEIRHIAYDLERNLFSDNINFITVVKDIFQAIEEHSETVFSLSVDEQIDWEMVNSNIKMQVYRILQEALQNIDKYAQAKKVKIIMRKTEEGISIEVSDDGIGFEKKKITKGFGLKNMKARAREIGGKLQIQSQDQEGTTINLTFPLQSE